MAFKRILFRRDTAANWTSVNPTLSNGEVGYETDTGKIKIGTGALVWTSLPYFVGNLPGGSLNDLGDVVITSAANGDFLRWNGTQWINDAVNLSTDTVGSYVESLVAGTGVSLINNAGEAATPTISIGQNVATSSSVTFAAITISNTPENDTHAATKAYVDGIAAGIKWKNSAELATAAPLPNLPSYDNGTAGVGATLTASTNGRLVVDGTNATTGDRILVKDQGSGIENGIYVVTNQGSVSTTWLLTRSIDFDGYIDEVVRGDALYVANGSTNVSQGFVVTTNGSGLNGHHDLGTDPIYFSQFTGTSAITVGTGISKSGNTISIGQDVATSSSVSFAVVTSTLNGNATTATSLLNPRTIAGKSFDGTANIDILAEDLYGLTVSTAEINELAGVTGNIQNQLDLKASASVSPTITLDGDLSGTVTLTSLGSGTLVATIQSDAVALGTNTTGNYVDDVIAGTGISVSHTPGEGSDPTVSLNANLNDLNDVQSFSPSDGQFLKFVSASSSWVPANIPIVNTLDDIGDVVITSASVGQFVKWNGSTWVNDTIDLGTDTAGNYMVDVIAGAGMAVTHTPGAGSSATVDLDAGIGELKDVFTNTDYPLDGEFFKYSSACGGWIPEQIYLGSDTVGDYVQNLSAGTGVAITNNSGEGSTPTIEIGQDVGTSASVEFHIIEAQYDVLVGRNLYVSGSVVTENQVSLEIDDPFIYLNTSASASGIDTGVVASYYDGSHKHAGYFRDSTDGKFKFFDSYTPEPSSPIDTDHISYSPAPIVAETFESTVTTGVAPFIVSSTTEVTNLHADTATTLHTARTVSLTGDVSGSVSFDGSSDATITATIANGAISLDEISDVNLNTPPSDGQFLKYVSASSAWVAGTIPTINSLDDIGDVSASAPSSGQFLKWNGSAWVSDTIVGGATVSTTPPSSPTAGQIWFESDTLKTYVYYDSYWIEIVGGSATATLDDVGDVNATGAVAGNILRYDGTQWSLTTIAANVAADDDQFVLSNRVFR